MICKTCVRFQKLDGYTSVQTVNFMFLKKAVVSTAKFLVFSCAFFFLDAFPTVFQAITARPSRFDMQETTALKITRNRHFNSKSSPQLHHNLNQVRHHVYSLLLT